MSNLSQFFGGGSDPAYWISGTNYAQGKTVRSQVDHQRYVRASAGAGTTDPANDTTNWRPDGGRAIKSIQRGNVTIPASSSVGTATITAVNTAKSVLEYLGGLGTDSGGSLAYIPRLSLTNSTTVTATTPTNVAATGITVAYQVVEYW